MTSQKLSLSNPSFSYTRLRSLLFWISTIGLLTSACSQSPTALEPTTKASPANLDEINSAEQNNQQKAILATSDANPATDTTAKNEYIASEAEYIASEIDYSDACIRNTCENPPPRLLSTDELNTIAAELSSALGPEEVLIRDQSFALTLPMIGRVDLVATESLNGRLSLHLRADPNQYEQIYAEQQWKLWELKAIGFEDIHQDGDGPDIIVIAEYVTGIGPEGAQPFVSPAILFNRGDDTFQNDIAVNRVLSEYNAQTVDDVITAAKADGLVRGLQYYEGP